MSASAAERRSNVSNTVRAGLTLPVGQTKTRLKLMHKKHMGDRAAVAATAGLEFVANEVLRSAGIIAGDKRARINPDHLHSGLIVNPELRVITEKINLMGGQVTPTIFPDDLKTNKEHLKARKKRKREEARAAAAAAASTADGDDDQASRPAAKKSSSSSAKKSSSPAKKSSSSPAKKSKK